MRTITVCFHNDDDAKKLMDIIESSSFVGSIEGYEMDEEISEEDMDGFEAKLDEYQDGPASEANYIRFKSEVKEKYGIGYIEKFK